VGGGVCGACFNNRSSVDFFDDDDFVSTFETGG
jgi:hypothetical protein